ncbi:MAG TPA: iron ABC transporter permease [Kofleriaceae bacterium]|nr:iron ABC transporter permease [Kofleriaceae bacterium]
MSEADRDPGATDGRAVIAALLCLIACGTAPFLGPSVTGDPAAFVFWQLRVPRLLVAMMVGATLSLVGACFQIIFANPLASESTVGTISGAALGALLALLTGVTIGPSGLPVVVLGAFAGALAVTFALTALAAHGRTRTNDVLLAGIALSLGASAISSMLQSLAASNASIAAAQWSLGQLVQVGYRGVLLLLPFTALVLGTLLLRARAFETLVAGEEQAHSQGVDVRSLRVVALGAGALGVGACVAWCGPIPFVGLIVPHVVRRLVPARPRSFLPLSTIGGAAFLAVCDTAARVLFPGREVPVGAITALIGAPTLIWLVVRRHAP